MIQKEKDEVVSLAIDFAYDVLRNRMNSMTPKQIISLGNFLYGVSKFPDIVGGLYVEFGLLYSNGNSDFSESVMLTFIINDESFSWSHNVSTYEKGVGRDHMEMSSYQLFVDGYSESSNYLDIYNIQSNLENFLNIGADLHFEDMSYLNMEYLNDDEED